MAPVSMNRSLRSIGVTFGFCGLLLAGAALVIAQPAKPDALTPKQYTAAILAKIPPYVRWPEAGLPSASDPFVIGLLGGDVEEEQFTRQLVAGVRVEGHEVTVKAFASVDDVTKCQILFVPATRAADWQNSSRNREFAHLLTVGENEDFEKSGGVMSVSARERKLHVFLSNARKAQLEIDARLLKIATVHR